MAASFSDSEQSKKGKTATYKAFETSAAIIKNARWKIDVKWEELGEEAAVKFIQTPPQTRRQRDSRRLMDKSRFRVLLVHEPDRGRLQEKNDAIIKAAKEHGWMNDQAMFLLDSRAGGVLLSEPASDIHFAVQTFRETNDAIHSLFLTEQHARSRRDADWVCLVFAADAGQEPNTVGDLLQADTFPSDFAAPLSPDLLFFPTALLHRQVRDIKETLLDLRNKIEAHVSQSLTRYGKDQKGLQTAIWTMRQTHLKLNSQATLAGDVAQMLQRCFDVLEGARAGDGFQAAYSQTLRVRVQSAADNLALLARELESLPLRIDAQQTALDSQRNLIMARQAVRDGNSMRTIAILTLVFLPGTFVAAIFSMSMFNWQASKSDTGDDGKIVSKWLWLYFAVAAGLTIIVIVAWLLWFKISDKKYKDDEENIGGALADIKAD